MKVPFRAAGTGLRAEAHTPSPARPGATVSVVITCYNYAGYLPEAVHSALAQSDVEVQVIVVDDASTDDSLAVARELAGGDPRVQIIASERNGGPVAAFNRGLEAATGEFLVRLDADDLLTPGALSRAVAIMQEFPRVGLVYGHPLHFLDPQRPPARTRATMWTVWKGREWMADRCLRGSNVITSPEVVLRRRVIDEVGGLRPLAHTHDMEWWLRVASQADVAYIRGADQAWHREHAGSLSTAAEQPLQILPEIRDAFDELFRSLPADHPHRGALQAGYRRAIAEMALTYARTSLDRGRTGEVVHALVALAEETDPSIVSSRSYRRASLRAAGRGLPPRMAATVGVVPRLRRRLADRRERRRWARSGMFEHFSLHRAAPRTAGAAPMGFDGAAGGRADTKGNHLMGATVRRLQSASGKAGRILRREGVRGLTQRVARALYLRTGADILNEPLRDADVADSTNLTLPVPGIRPQRGEGLTIGWVTVPPAGGSGGHTTLFRMVVAAEAAGHQCEIFLFDRFGGDIAEYTRTIREWWPEMKATIRDAANGIDGVDAAVASSWSTAHILARRGTSPMRRLYFIQDFEPFFYPHGSMYTLAEDTYRFGFRNIALGEMVAQSLQAETGVSAEVTEFGCDTRAYRPLPDRTRTGIVVYARPDNPRRGFWLARLALEEFHRLHPDVDIHLYGDPVEGLTIPATQHGSLPPVQLNELYNSCIAGIALSFTNISLVAEEMLAAGTIPVVNDSPGSRADLANEHVAWTTPTPHKIAEALSRAVTNPDRDEKAAAAAASVRPFGWAKAEADVVRIIEEEVYGK